MRTVRGITLLEVMVVTAASVAVATAAGVSVADQVRRARATEGVRNVYHPHVVARDSAVGARTCTETLVIPPLGAGAPVLPDGVTAAQVPQNNGTRIAVIEWSDCGDTATVSRVSLFDIDGDITLSPYSSTDGRVVFSPQGGLTNERPGTIGRHPPSTATPGGGVIVGDFSKCTPGGGGDGNSGVAMEGEGEDPRGSPLCSPPGPLGEEGPPPDVSFAATAFFGKHVDYRIYARVGATEALNP
jgi:type II secretory pathway pseudopilin PulG